MVPGTVLLGKYRVDDQLGIGGMARVVRAMHLYLQQPVAIKMLLPEMVESDSTVARFLREAQATVRLRSEHIARVQDVGTLDDGTPFMVMEYLDGNDLNQILRHHGPQAPNVVVDLMLQACEGISEAHANGIVHRDIKPSNFFITRRPDGSMLLKILDFGISKAPVGYDDLTGTQTVIGTPTYMAPEQMKSGKHADPRSDIWSLGIVMYQLITGRPPFVGESYAELILKVGGEVPQPIHVALPAGLGEIIFRCLEKSPSARFQDAAELARFLAPFASDPASAAQSALRAQRILTSVRNSRVGIPISGPADLATPVPISPAMLTPSGGHAPPSHMSSLSHGRGQATAMVAGSGRTGWIVAGALALTMIAGVGGFVASRYLGKDAPHAAAAPITPGPTPMPVVASPPVAGGVGGGGDGEKPATDPKPDDAKPAVKPGEAKPAGGTDGSADPPKQPEFTPTFPATPEADGKTAAKDADGKDADGKATTTTATKPPPAKTETKATAAKTGTTTTAKPAPADATRATTMKTATTTKPTAAKPTTAKTTTTKTTTTKTTTAKTTTKPPAKPTTTKPPKKTDDLFDSRK